MSFVDENALTVNVAIDCVKKLGQRRDCPEFIATKNGVGYLIPQDREVMDNENTGPNV